jgi:hypothetical protein
MITLQDGDFGADATASFTDEDLLLPDPKRPGLKQQVPLANVVEIDAIGGDRSAQFKEALSLSARGFGAAGPAGLAMGLYAATRVRDVIFSARLEDGREFVAKADAGTFADLHSKQVSARVAALLGGSYDPADDVIDKYLQPKPEADAATPSEPPTRIEPAPAPVPVIERPVVASVRPERPVFGRRRG